MTLQKQKEEAEHRANIVTNANEELVSEIRKLNIASGLYGVTPKEERQKENIRRYDNEEREIEVRYVEVKREEQPKIKYVEVPKNKKEEDEEIKKVKIESPFSDRFKANTMFFVGLAIVILLAVGVYPTGKFWESIQNSWIELIADVFKVFLIAIAGGLLFSAFRKNNK